MVYAIGMTLRVTEPVWASDTLAHKSTPAFFRNRVGTRVWVGRIVARRRRPNSEKRSLTIEVSESSGYHPFTPGTSRRLAAAGRGEEIDP